VQRPPRARRYTETRAIANAYVNIIVIYLFLLMVGGLLMRQLNPSCPLFVCHWHVIHRSYYARKRKLNVSRTYNRSAQITRYCFPRRSNVWVLISSRSVKYLYGTRVAYVLLLLLCAGRFAFFDTAACPYFLRLWAAAVREGRGAFIVFYGCGFFFRPRT